ncbi:MAG: hypothetical protein EXS37_06970 [Opitutus sp.]|nr:hypothetical protein [Opitutus sp.]
MGTTKRAKSEWPRIVKSGHASVKIYRNVQHERKKGGPYVVYVLTWRTPTGRQRQKFKDVKTAISEARLKADHLAEGRVESARMTTGDCDELAAARELAGDVPLLSALREWKKIQALSKGQGIAAAELWAQHNQSSLKRIKVGDAIDLFIKGKERAGKQGERTYRSKLKPLGVFFPDRYLDALTSDELTAYLEKYQDGVTRNDFRKRAVALFRWAQKSGYMPRGIQLEIEHTERADEKPTEIGTITPDTYAKLLDYFRVKHPQHLAALVLAGFCGIRADEIHGKHHDRSKRQIWEDINLEKKYLNVTVAKKNTPSWRLVTLCDAAVEWLMLCGERKGPVCEIGAMAKIRALAHDAKTSDKKARFQKLPENCFRHSAISYRIAVTGDKAATATWAGNSVAEIDRRYRRPMTKEAGEAWFSFRPKADAEEITMPKQATA